MLAQTAASIARRRTRGLIGRLSSTALRCTRDIKGPRRSTRQAPVSGSAAPLVAGRGPNQGGRGPRPCALVGARLAEGSLGAGVPPVQGGWCWELGRRAGALLRCLHRQQHQQRVRDSSRGAAGRAGPARITARPAASQRAQQRRRVSRTMQQQVIFVPEGMQTGEWLSLGEPG